MKNPRVMGALLLPLKLTAWGVVADARGDLVVVAGDFDADASEASVARGVGGGVVERVLVAQLVRDLRVDAVERVEALWLVEPPARLLRQAGEVRLALREHAQGFAQVADAQLVEAHGRVGAGEQVVEFALLARALDLRVRDDVDGDLRLEQRAQCRLRRGRAAVAVNAVA